MIVEPEDLFVVISYETSDLEDCKSIIFKFVSMILLSFSIGEGFFFVLQSLTSASESRKCVILGSWLISPSQ